MACELRGPSIASTVSSEVLQLLRLHRGRGAADSQRSFNRFDCIAAGELPTHIRAVRASTIGYAVFSATPLGIANRTRIAHATTASAKGKRGNNREKQACHSAHNVGNHTAHTPRRTITSTGHGLAARLAPCAASILLVRRRTLASGGAREMRLDSSSQLAMRWPSASGAGLRRSQSARRARSAAVTASGDHCPQRPLQWS
jgi:hypothetical protein